MPKGIKFDSDVMDSITSKSRQINTILSSVGSPKGKLLTGSLLGSGISKLNSSIKKHASKMNRVQSAVSKQKDALFTAEASLRSEVESIVIPNNFNISDFNPLNQNNAEGEKNDQGKKIKTDSEINQEKLNEYVQASDQALANINKNDPTKMQEYDTNTTINNEALENINNEEPTQQQEYDDNSNIEEKEKLQNINNNVTEEQTYDSSSIVNNEILGNINNENQTQQQEYNDNSKVVAEELKNLNNEEPTQQQEYNDNSKIAAEELKNVNNNVVKEQPVEEKFKIKLADFSDLKTNVKSVNTNNNFQVNNVNAVTENNSSIGNENNNKIIGDYYDDKN